MTLVRLSFVFALLLTGTAFAVHAYVDHMRPRPAAALASLEATPALACGWDGPTAHGDELPPCRRIDAPQWRVGEPACAAAGEAPCEGCPSEAADRQDEGGIEARAIPARAPTFR